MVLITSNVENRSKDNWKLLIQIEMVSPPNVYLTVDIFKADNNFFFFLLLKLFFCLREIRVGSQKAMSELKGELF